MLYHCIKVTYRKTPYEPGCAGAGGMPLRLRISPTSFPNFSLTPETFLSILSIRKSSSQSDWLYSFDGRWGNEQFMLSLFVPGSWNKATSNTVQAMTAHVSTLILFLALFLYPKSPFALLCSSVFYCYVNFCKLLKSVLKRVWYWIIM